MSNIVHNKIHVLKNYNSIIINIFIKFITQANVNINAIKMLIWLIKKRIN